jgi:flavin reductase (DIM6/NTAB) family NADH-FMN oxidoreductase RutF
MQHQKLQQAHAAALDIAELRQTLGSFVTGVTVVATLDSEGAPKGFTGNSFTSVSLDPPLLLVCVDKGAGCYPAFTSTAKFGVNILCGDQQHVSSRFASKSADNFSEIAWVSGITGSPILPDSTAWLDCQLHDRLEAGDHLILIGKVLSFGHSPEKQPLGYHRDSYIAFGPAADARSLSRGSRDQEQCQSGNKTGSRRIIDYLLSPLLRYSQESLRER